MKTYQNWHKNLGARLSGLLTTSARFLVFLYRAHLSPYLGGNCRFHPSCSEYAEQAFQRHSFFKATGLISKRLIKCHPFGPSGLDPVPQASNSMCYGERVNGR